LIVDQSAAGDVGQVRLPVIMTFDQSAAGDVGQVRLPIICGLNEC